MGREQFLQLFSSGLETQRWGEGLSGNFEKRSSWRSCKAVGNDLRGGFSWGVSLPPLRPPRESTQECKAPRSLPVWGQDCKQRWLSVNPVLGTLRTSFCLISVFLTAPWHDMYYRPHSAEGTTEIKVHRIWPKSFCCEVAGSRFESWQDVVCKKKKKKKKNWTNAVKRHITEIIGLVAIKPVS